MMIITFLSSLVWGFEKKDREEESVGVETRRKAEGVRHERDRENRESRE